MRAALVLALALALAGCDHAQPAAPPGACTVVLDPLTAYTGIPVVAVCHTRAGFTCVYDAQEPAGRVQEDGGVSVLYTADCDRCTGATLRGLGAHCEPPTIPHDMGSIRIDNVDAGF